MVLLPEGADGSDRAFSAASFNDANRIAPDRSNRRRPSLRSAAADFRAARSSLAVAPAGEICPADCSYQGRTLVSAVDRVIRRSDPAADCYEGKRCEMDGLQIVEKL